jgi:sigma-B regulation protein RsbU (phosphoserine phosphatase)
MSWFFLLASALAICWLWRLLVEKNRKEKELLARLKTLRHEKKVVLDFLHDLGEAFTDNLDRDQMLKIILRCAQKVADARGVILYLWDPGHRQLRAQAIEGIFPPPFAVPESVADKIAARREYLDTLLMSDPLSKDDLSVIAQVAQSGDAVRIADATHDSRFPKFREESISVRSYMAVPLVYRDEKLGVMALANHQDGSAFSESDFEIIKSVADQAAYSLHHAQVYGQLADKKKMDNDLLVAREIQRILLPLESPVLPGYELAATNEPAQQLSGDYYDFIQVDPVRWGMAIADVSGKGVPASLIMAMCRSVLRSKAVGNPSPAQVLREVNRLLYPDIREDMFITMVYAILNTAENTLTLARAGHEAPLLAKKNFEVIEPLNAPGMALGIDSGDVFDEIVQDLTLALEPQDTFMVYTDGINEASDENGQEFGKNQIKEALKASGPQGAGFLVRNLVERVQRFSGGKLQNDDITLVALQRKKE